MPTNDEREELSGFLDWYRVVAANKLRGLSEPDAVRVATPSGVTVHGTIKHLTWVERLWFSTNFLGEAREDLDASTSFQVRDTDTVAASLARYDDACDRSREVLEATENLEQRAEVPHHYYGHVSMRWILIHLIEETSRHAGHLDVLRESTDGQTGD